MIELNLLNLILQGIPETTATAAVVYAMNNYPFDWKRLFLIGALQGFTIYLIRLLPITFGIHIFWGVVTLSIYVQAFTKKSYLGVIKASILAILLLVALEFVANIPILRMLDISMVEASRNDLLWIMLGWPQVMGLFITAFLINRYHERRAVKSIEESRNA